MCLMRYLPRTMSRHRRMKTMTATTPPITAWSMPEVVVMAVGSWERQPWVWVRKVRAGEDGEGGEGDEGLAP